ncbi:MAG: hypothetical protein GQE15_35095, partial [Archangiaceae bacterium]|nr:hypothetical protein [Archangiaceae bacterium]
MKNVRLAVLAVMVVSAQAWAQIPPFTRTTTPYASLVGASALTFGSTDEGFAAVTLPFGFPYNGTTYQTVYVHVNGQILLSLPTACSATATSCTTYTSINPLPTASSPVQNHISAVWDDAQIGANTQIRVLSTPAKVTVEWVNLEDFSFSNPAWTATFQIALEPSGNFSIHYGPITGTASFMAGYQAGTLGYAVLGTGCLPTAQASCCGSTSNTARCGSQYTSDVLISTEPPLSPDLIASSVRVSNFQTIQPSNDLSMTVTVRAANYSRSPANNWAWRAFLSPDPFRDPSDGGPGLADGGTGANDIPLDPETSGNSLSPQGSQDFSTVVTTSSPPPAGDYYVIVELDTQNAVAEVSEANNIAVLPYAITGGVDLVSTNITGVATSGPDSVDSVRLQYFNRGGSTAGTINYRIMLASGRDAGLVVFP